MLNIIRKAKAEGKMAKGRRQIGSGSMADRQLASR